MEARDECVWVGGSSRVKQSSDFVSFKMAPTNIMMRESWTPNLLRIFVEATSTGEMSCSPSAIADNGHTEWARDNARNRVVSHV